MSKNKSVHFDDKKRIIWLVFLVVVFGYFMLSLEYYFKPRCENICRENGMEFLELETQGADNIQGCTCLTSAGAKVNIFHDPSFLGLKIFHLTMRSLV